MKLLAFIILASISLPACEKNKDSDTIVLDGAYSGTFSRTGMATSNVLLHFSNSSFDGTSDTGKYPAICHGSFETDEHNISFADACTWTADFDWTLILNGNYSIDLTSDDLIRIRRSNGSVTDEYLLRKVTR